MGSRLRSGRCSFIFSVIASTVILAGDPGPEPPPPKAEGGSTDPAGPSDDRKADDPVVLDEIVVTAWRIEEDPYDVSRSITAASREEIVRRDATTALETLDDRIGIWVEKRTATTSDPIIRGLSGGNLLTLIDGNTLSTFWGEGGFAGDDMYGKIDGETVERIEVLRGPASVHYGSNALGGVLNFITRSSPIDYTERGFRPGGRIKGGYGSAAQEYRGRAEAYGATPFLKYFAGVSGRDIDDVQGGRGLGVLRPTSGNDLDFDGKLQFLATNSSEVTISVQNVHRRDLHRYYRPAEDNENVRQGYDVTYRIDDPTPFWSEVKFNLYHQYKEDRRNWFSTGNEGVARWWTYAGDVQMTTPIVETNSITYGLGLRRDEGESPDDEQFTVTEPDGDRYKAAPDSTWDNLGFFAADDWDLTPRLRLTTGLRFDLFRFDADPDSVYANNPAATAPELDDFTDHESSLTGGVGLLYEVTEEWHPFASYSRGFRQFAPNFGVRQLGYGVLVPNELLDPVTADNYEVGLKWRYPSIDGAVAGYYTDFNDFQNILPGTFAGSEYLDIEGNGIEADDRVYATRGGGEAYLYGVEAEGAIQPRIFLPTMIGPEWSVRGGFMWNFGEDTTNDEPLRHTHPARGLVALHWDDPDRDRGIWWQFGAEFVRHFDRIPSGRVDSDPAFRKDPQDPASGRLRADGSIPGYTVLDLRGGFNLTRHARVILGVENLTDKKYRVAHSRMDAPGINFHASMEVWF
jgi:hemoglobin/transferrin/lactoferrin receptor protein